MNNLNKNDQDFIAGIRHERKNVQSRGMVDLFLAEIERWADPPRTLRERRSKPPLADSGLSEADRPTTEPFPGLSDDFMG